jgi:hypothetical protein
MLPSAAGSDAIPNRHATSLKQVRFDARAAGPDRLNGISGIDLIDGRRRT